MKPIVQGEPMIAQPRLVVYACRPPSKIGCEIKPISPYCPPKGCLVMSASTTDLVVNDAPQDVSFGIEVLIASFIAGLFR